MSRHASPMLVGPEGQVTALRRLELGRGDEDRGRREAFVQNLVHEHPELIPMAEIEPAFSPLISVCRELETAAGYIDNLWLTPWGGLVVGECKLVRNPQARREVVAQALDYGRALAGWSYGELERAVGAALKRPGVRLWEFVSELTDLDEPQFVDAVERRLRMGRVLLLIIGDGIQEGVEALTEHLQLHAGLHVGLALVDLSLWQGSDGGLLVVPRVPMKTVLIERGIVLVRDPGQAIISPLSAIAPARPDARARVSTQSEGEFFDQLGAKRPEAVAGLKSFLADVTSLGITPEFRKSVVLRFTPSPDVTASGGYIETTGRVWLGDAYNAAARAGAPDAGSRYLDAVASAISGSVKLYERSPPQVIDSTGQVADVARLLNAASAWKQALGELVEELRALASQA